MKRKLLNRFSELLAIKERQVGRSISQREVAESIGASTRTINKIAQNKADEYLHRVTFEKLMDYFGVDHSEMFTTEMVDDPETERTVIEAA